MWFDEYETLGKQDVYKYDDQEDVLSNAPDLLFSDIEDLVKKINDGCDEDIHVLQESASNMLLDLEIQRDALFDDIHFLWENVMKPFVEDDCCLILQKDISKTKSAFFEWVYNTTNIKKQFDYLMLLNNKLNKIATL